MVKQRSINKILLKSKNTSKDVRGLIKRGDKSGKEGINRYSTAKRNLQSQ